MFTAVITMPSIHSLINKLAAEYPQFTFAKGDAFQWSAEHNTITFREDDSDAGPQLLHELSHALLQHKTYERDIKLIGLERDAWEYAKETLSENYNTPIADDIIQTSLNSYRDWLHARSTCPTCTATGIEITKKTYRCPACQGEWGVNEARVCGLRRYRIQK